MVRSLSLLALALLTGCSSDERKPASGDIFPNTGGSGGTSAMDATSDAPGDADDAGAAGAELPEGGSDASDATVDGPEIACVVDPIPTQGQDYCVTAGQDGYDCNPISGVPCDLGAGETCDFDGERFRCLPQDFASVPPCGLCSTPYPNTCIPGFTCLGLGGKCTRYCCDSLQCAFGELCVMQPPTSVGICQATSDQAFSGFLGAEQKDAGPIEAGPPERSAECNPPSGFGNGDCVTIEPDLFNCNPVTNAGCGPGEACDVVDSIWQCVSGSHEHDICEPCTSTSCKPGSTCIPSLGCVKYCCTDADCDPGECEEFVGLDGLGTCRAATVPLGS